MCLFLVTFEQFLFLELEEMLPLLQRISSPAVGTFKPPPIVVMLPLQSYSTVVFGTAVGHG